MRLTELTDSEILLHLEVLSQKHSVKLRFAHKLFYVSLLHLCEKIGIYDEKTGLYFVEFSINDFAGKFKLSPTSVVQALKLLVECGVIRRGKQQRTFRKISSGDYFVNGAYRTFLIPIE